MIAILIFAGRSKRFWPLEEKSFFPIAGTTLLEEQVRRLKAAGVKKIMLVGGAHNLMHAKAVLPKITLVEQEDLDLGMRGALLSSLPQCGKESVMIVSANDVIESSAYKALMKKAASVKSGGVILARKVSQYFPGGYLTVQGNRITGIVEKPGAGKEPSDLVNIVAHVHASASELLEALRAARTERDDGYEVALDTLMKKNTYVAVPYTEGWQTVKYPWHILSLAEALLPQGKKPQIHPTAKIHRTAVIEGSVVIGAHVQVFAHASIMGPCYIGEGSVIANNALVRGSSLGKRCVIGYNTEVARSVLGDDVWTHSSYLGDSVLGSNISLGAGTTTGNLRFDEGEITSVIGEEAMPTGKTKLGVILGSGCRTGVHTCFAPGVKVGAGSFVNAMTMVTHDIPTSSFVKMKAGGGLDIRNNAVKLSDSSSRSALMGKLKQRG